MKTKGHTLTDSNKRFIQKYFKEHSSAWIASQLGCSSSNVRRYAQMQGLEHSDNFWDNFYKEKTKKLTNKNSITKRANTLSELIRRDKRRIRIGLEPLLRRTYKDDIYGRKLINARYKLKQHGYSCERNGNIVSFDNNTRRSTRMEERCKKFGFFFIQTTDTGQ